MRFLYFAICLLLLTSSSCQNHPLKKKIASTIDPKNISTIPFGYASDYSKMENHRGPVIQINSDSFTPHKVNVIVDTGWTNNSFVQPVVAKLPTKLIQVIGKNRSIRCVNIPRYDVGDYPLSGDAEVFPKQKFASMFSHNMRGGKDSLAGILGTAFLSDYACLFDFKQKQLSVIDRTNDLESLSNQDLMFLGFAPDKTITLPIYPTKQLVYLVDITVGTKRRRLLLDTGAGDTYVVDKTEYTQYARQKNTKARKIMSRSFSINQITYLTKQKATVGSGIGMETSVIYSKKFYSEGSDPSCEGVIGSNFLSHFRVLIDFPNRKLYLMPIDLH